MVGAGSFYSNQKSLVVSTRGTDPRGDLYIIITIKLITISYIIIRL